MATEYLPGISYGFYGQRLDTVQRVQRLYFAGFKDADLLALAYAVMMGESGGYLKAFHHNVERNEDGTIKREEVDGLTFMRVKSTDLGFIQRNVVHANKPLVELTEGASKAFVDDLFLANPKLANGWESCKIAWQLYQQRGFDPWYAYSNGGWKRSIGHASLAVGKWLAHRYLDDPGLIQQRDT
jgi:hypothetical protein